MGDLIIARQNDNHLDAGQPGRTLANGDWLRVRAIGDAGLTVSRLIRLPPLLGLLWRRPAVAVALELASWYIIIVFGSLPDYVSTLGISGLRRWTWLAHGDV